MDTTTQFDLERAVQAWLTQVTQGGDLTTGNVDELHDHLLTHVEHGRAAGLQDAEALRAAVAAIGPVHALQQEFSKANLSLRWMRYALALVIGLLASLSFWIMGIAFNATVSSIGYWVDAPIPVMHVVTPISISLSWLAIALLIGYMIARPQRALGLLRAALAKHRGVAWGLAALPWLGSIYSNAISVYWFADGSTRWHIWDWMDAFALYHTLSFVALAVGVVFGLGLFVAQTGFKIPAPLAIGIFGLLLQPCLFWVANHLPEWGAANELVPMFFFLLSSIMTAIWLRRTEKRKLWPA